MKQIITIFTAFISALCVAHPAHAGMRDAWHNISFHVSNWLHTAGEYALGGGVIIVAVLGLITAIAGIFTLMMMMRR